MSFTVQVTDSHGAAASASLSIPQAGAPIDLTQGLVTGKAKVSYTAAARPAKGVPFTDPDFHTRIIRVTDVQADWNGNTAVPVYPTVPTWNCDESYMLLYIRGGPGQYALFNGKTYAFLKWVSITPADIEQFNWDPVNPDVLWYISGKSLTQYHISSGTKTVTHTFSSNADWGDDPIYFSWDGSLYGLREQSSKTILSLKNGVEHSIAGSGSSPEACASGNYLFWAKSSQATILNLDMTTLRTMTMKNAIEHGDLGMDSQGQDYWVGVSFNEGPSGSSGLIMVEWVKSGVIKTIIGDANADPYPPNGALISSKALKNPGWVCAAATGNTALVPTYQDQEIIVANVETGKFARVCHHRSRGENGPIGYWAQPNVTLSPTGTRIVFPSDWGSGSVVDTYVVELPSYSG